MSRAGAALLLALAAACEVRGETAGYEEAPALDAFCSYASA